MKKSLIAALLLFATSVCFAQSKLVSYDDLSYLLHNNIDKADTFFVTKGFDLVKKDIKKKTRQYSLQIPGGTYANFNLRNDGRRMFIEIVTNELPQYNLIYNSISQYVDSTSTSADMQAFKVKDLGMIYVMSQDAVPYNPLRRVYTIQIAPDKGITAYN